MRGRRWPGWAWGVDRRTRARRGHRRRRPPQTTKSRPGNVRSLVRNRGPRHGMSLVRVGRRGGAQGGDRSRRSVQTRPSLDDGSVIVHCFSRHLAHRVLRTYPPPQKKCQTWFDLRCLGQTPSIIDARSASLCVESPTKSCMSLMGASRPSIHAGAHSFVGKQYNLESHPHRIGIPIHNDRQSPGHVASHPL